MYSHKYYQKSILKKIEKKIGKQNKNSSHNHK